MSSFNPYSSLIDGLNSESPVISSPEDYADELSLWTNAEFTFDIPPGMGIFETDSGVLKASPTAATADPAPVAAPALAVSEPTLTAVTTSPSAPAVVSPALLSAAASAKAASSQQVMDQQHLMDYLHLPQDESRPLSLLERTRMRNPIQVAIPQQQPQSQLEEQVTAINAFHSLLAAYTAQQHQQQQQPAQQQQPTSNLPTLLPIAPATAPTTPAAAKLLRQPMPQYKSPALLQAKKKIEPVVLPAPAPAPASPVTTPTSPASVNAVAILSKDQQDKKNESAVAAIDPNASPEYLAKLAAEEDKRRRNTAASARFRQKKKLREQALEQTAREQTARAEALEIRVKELEMEVKWLRGLIVEKKSEVSLPTPTVAASSVEEDSANKRIKLDVY